MNNSKLGAKNVTWGIIAQIITTGIGILIPRLVLVNLGSDANGLLTSISSILAYLSLLEAGVGTATLQALYSPIAKQNKDSINSILSATHFFYKRTGFVYSVVVVLLSLGYALFIPTPFSPICVFFLVLLPGASGVISFFCQGKYKLLLQAEGKGYILTNVTTITTVLVSATKAVLLLCGGNILAIQSVYFAFNFAQTIYIVAYIKKHYRWISLGARPNFNAISQKNAILVSQVSSLVFYNTDNIILTAFTSLKTVSVYSMYAMIFGMVKSICITLTDSFIFALGQAYSDKKRFLVMYNAYEVYNVSLTFSLYCVTGILILPFLRLYTAGVNDVNYINDKVALLFLLYYLMDNGRKPSGILINIAQHFEQTKWRNVIEAIINLISSVVFAYFFGIYGVLLGTILALLYRANDMIIYSAKLLSRSPWITYKRWLRNALVLTAFLFFCRYLNLTIDNYGEFLVTGLVLSIAIIPSFFLINAAFERDSAKYIIGVLKRMVHGK